MRGGVSTNTPRTLSHVPSSPRAWGCFYFPSGCRMLFQVFPTCVGVFRHTSFLRLWAPGLPHVRGGVSPERRLCAASIRSSPRAWGCFLLPPPPENVCRVFPTCVGVFLGLIWVVSVGECLPHVRGGVSAYIYGLTACLTGLPHVRGGVSLRGSSGSVRATSSPRAWGCFYLPVHLGEYPGVFPTCVGVFPHKRGSAGPLKRRKPCL